MTTDKNIEGCVPRNASVPEELSRVEYIFTDKTGTLTKNEMTIKKLFMWNGHEIDLNGEESSISLIKKVLGKNYVAFPP